MEQKLFLACISVAAVDSTHCRTECSRTTGSHRNELVIPSNDINCCSTPTAIIGSYTHTHNKPTPVSN